MNKQTIIAIIAIIIIIIFVNFSKYEHLEAPDYLENMKIFIISLKSRPDRKKLAIDELKKHNLLQNSTFVEAVNGKNMTDAEIKAVYKFDEKYRKLRKGEIGCYLSHIDCWKRILASGMPYGMIIEDDVTFIDDFRKVFNDVFNNVKDMKWDMISLGRSCREGWFPLPCDSGKLIYGDNVMYPDSLGYGTYAYIIKTELIKELLKESLPMSQPVDVVLLEKQQAGTLTNITFKKYLAVTRDLKDSDTTHIV